MNPILNHSIKINEHLCVTTTARTTRGSQRTTWTAQT
uniref:Uncharacterized protein n=1 Tax=Anguilla anguilla TaxID=7936 RepID=A0A0E9PCZ8_ANGAN